MPLLDHFHAPLFPLFYWESFHSHWPSILTNQLNAGLLPREYVAAPHVKMGIEVEIDVAALEFGHSEGGGGTATAVYAPPQPPLAIPVDFTQSDLFEILIRPEGSARLVAAIEFVSPANKDRAGNREAFAIKCASYLQEGATVLVVDIVTNRSPNLFKEIVSLLAENPGALEQPPASLYTVSCRPVASQLGQVHLEVWPATLELGKPLPTLPMWLGADCVIPIDLEQSYLETCATLRIRAG